MARLSRSLAATLAAVAAASVAVPGSAYAVGNGQATLLKNYGNNLCMGVAGGDSKVQDGTAIITWTCDGTGNQTWIYILADPNQPSGPYVIENSVNTGECLSVAAKGTSAGSRLVVWHCKAASDNQDQRWYVSGDRQSPYVYLWNFNASANSMVATALNTGNGAPVALEQQGNTWFPEDAWLSS